jgi:nucleolar protein 56
LANKCSIATRIDSFSDEPTNVYGEKLREQVEERLKFYETGAAPRKNLDVMEQIRKSIESEKKADIDDDDVDMETPKKKKEKKEKKSEKKKRKLESDDEEEAAAATPSTDKKEKKEKKSEKKSSKKKKKSSKD